MITTIYTFGGMFTNVSRYSGLFVKVDNKYWYKNKVIHRYNGPAMEYADGTKKWMLFGRFHRLDGPAEVYADGREEYWVNGLYYDNYLEYLVAVAQFDNV